MYEHVVAAFMAEPWFLTQAKGRAIAGLLEVRGRGEKVSPEEVRAIVQVREATLAAHSAAAAAGQSQGRAVAVLPLYGVMSPRVGMMEESSGMVSTERWARSFQAMVNDPAVSAIVLDVDSPGGSVYGCDELAARVFAARETKPIYAVANQEADSAAYYVASQAHEFAVTPSGEVGSIGVWSAHVDLSVALELAGESWTFIQTGKYKTEGNTANPLGDEALAFFQKRSAEWYEMFVKAVARGRGVAASVVRGERFGQGRSYGAKEAVERGMADRVATLEETIARAASGKLVARGGLKAEAGGSGDAAAVLALRRRRLANEALA